MREVKFFVNIAGLDGMVVTVTDDVNRPNNEDVDAVLTQWINDNYGYKVYEYWQLDACEEHKI